MLSCRFNEACYSSQARFSHHLLDLFAESGSNSYAMLKEEEQILLATQPLNYTDGP